MSSLNKIILDDRHPLWLIDAIILSAVVYSKNPQEELAELDKAYGLPPSAKYDFMSEEELNEAGFESCRQTLMVVRSQSGNHIIVAFRGTFDISDALTDLNFIQRTLSLCEGAAHAGFLDRAKTIPLDYFRRLLVRGENLVLTGHSLGGAVASLLALRLLESTGRWCHEQLQCYTFGSPFFADYRLARHINMNYKHHFVHIVSRTDIVPKVMPVAYLFYSLWAGLQAGPLQDLVHLINLGIMGAQLFLKGKRGKGLSFKFKFFTVFTQAAAWMPGIVRMILHRALALALSHHSGCGYAFAGHMVLLDPEKRELECVDQDMWTVKHHIDFHLGAIDLDVMKGHSLLSYIEHVFAIQSAELTASTATLDKPKAPKVEVCSASLNMKWYKKKKGISKPGKRWPAFQAIKEEPVEGLESLTEPGSDENGSDSPKTVATRWKKKRQPLRVFRSKVACLIFARRIQEASAAGYMQKQQRRRPFMRFLVITLGRASRFAHQFDILFMLSSVFYIGSQIHKAWTSHRSSAPMIESSSSSSS